MPSHSDKSVPGLFLLTVGDSHALEMLRIKLSGFSGVEKVNQVANMHYAWSEIRSGRVNAMLVDLAAPHDNIANIALNVFRIREEFPEIVFAFMANAEEFDDATESLAPDARSRLRHYYRIRRAASDDELTALTDRFVAWRRDYVAMRPYTQRYSYDVALSFAGEDRPYAEQLATVLRAQGVRVFYDDFELASLWGKNLYEHLFAVYSEQSRYCIMFISSAYAQKMWTVHERRAAQERVLKDRDSEYLLPVRVDDTRLPGIPDSVAYLPVRLGIPEIARLFVTKLGGQIGALS